MLYYHSSVIDWMSHNWWIVILPFAKAIIKKILAMKLVLLLKAAGILLFNLLKLLILKIAKTLTVRYGVFFSQRKWRWARWSKVMFLRRGRQFFRAANRFWNTYSKGQKWFITIAFFPVVIVLFFLGLSFNVTRKTIVQKTQETAIFKTAVNASNSSRGVRAWVTKLDKMVLAQIKALNMGNKDRS